MRAFGIIPARAGFTQLVDRGQGRQGDHPRSRGVYTTGRATTTPPTGSSPLARGLRAPDACNDLKSRIIPARAGFTRLQRPEVTRDRDHPRSRGVYGEAERARGRPSGSSPLARGLPHHREGRGRGAGIIPARAGFTPDGDRLEDVRRDHPRSRGVYTAGGGGRWRGAGSSPLARGLRAGVASRRRARGIIPARAGFTVLGQAVHDDPEDHPRSRGVYGYAMYKTYLAEGSSPLARGLLDQPVDSVVHLRIIPARAGFTAPSPRVSCSCRDHPRSRGVYSIVPSTGRPSAGSSPLARGLRYVFTPALTCSRIIPARAGFTGGRAPPGARRRDHPRSRGVYERGSTPVRYPWDHPRSRGVYISRSRSRTSSGGSSPLARGLPSAGTSTTTLRGIIPARAGFTPGSSQHGSTGSDHPRSRGVYSLSLFGWKMGWGSSPLARGLHYAAPGAVDRDGIIPARAGFTPAQRAADPPLWDHPRSRGVYVSGDDHEGWRTGSSPLARGLPPAEKPSLRARRIIPARAGFTRATSPGRGPGRDHPRSRGVYSSTGSGRAPTNGSSPLARGLPWCGAVVAVMAGIIPARAGFTRTPSRSSPSPRDHPRSRGVY